MKNKLNMSNRPILFHIGLWNRTTLGEVCHCCWIYPLPLPPCPPLSSPLVVEATPDPTAIQDTSVASTAERKEVHSSVSTHKDIYNRHNGNPTSGN